MGLLGAMVAGGVKGYADSRIDTLEKKEAFDLKMELLNAESEKQLLLKREGIKMEDDRAQARRDKVKEIEGRVKDPYEGKGGYESEADAEKRQRGLLEQRANELLKEGYDDEASNRYKRIDTYDKNAAGAAKLENDRWKSELGNEIKRQDLSIKEANAKRDNDMAEWKMKNIQNGAGSKPTAEQIKLNTFLDAYGEDPKYVSKGKLTQAGYEKFNKINTPVEYDEVTEKTYDGDTERSVKSKIPRGSMQKPVAVYQQGKGLVYK